MVIFITGKPGCGKSYLISEIIKELKKEGKKIAGIVSPEIRKNKKRWGFKIIDLASGKEKVMASIEEKEGSRVSKYKVNVKNIDEIVDLFLKSFAQADYIFIDELGKMELFSDKFKQMLQNVFSSDKKIIIALHRNLVDEYKKKGEVIWMERNKIEEIKERILKETD